jgi:hypothetical protein
MKTIRYTSIALLALALPLIAQGQAEKAERSRLAGISLPANTLLLTDADTIKQLETLLNQVVEAAKLKTSSGRPEVLIWAGDTYKRGNAAAIRKQINDALRQAGYACEEQRDDSDKSAETYLITAVKGEQLLIGLWSVQDSLLMLAWTAAAAAPAGKTDTERAEPEKADMAELFGGDPEEVLAKGSPNLTRRMVNQVREFLEWGFQAPLTREQRARIQSLMVADWKKGDKEAIEGALEIVKLADQVAEMKPEERAVIRIKVQEELVKGLRAQKSDPDAQWLLSIYEKAHKPLAPGSPPLTRQMTDAQVEMITFILGEALEQPITPDAAMKEDWAKQAAAQYAKLTPAQQKEMAGLPMQWAQLQFAWSRATPQERAEVREEWKRAIAGRLPQPQGIQTAERALQEIAKMLPAGKTVESLSGAQRQRAAQLLEQAAGALRKEGGDRNIQMSDQLTELAGSLRRPPSPPASSRSSSASGARARQNNTLSSLQSTLAMQRAYSNMINFQQQMHYSRINTINAGFGNPYRYVNAYGNPY